MGLAEQLSAPEVTAPSRSTARAFPFDTLQKIIRPDHGSPHVRGGRTVEAESLLRLLEVAADHVSELLGIHRPVILERIQVVNRDQSRSHVPAVRTRIPMRLLDVLRRLIVRAEELAV